MLMIYKLCSVLLQAMCFYIFHVLEYKKTLLWMVAFRNVFAERRCEVKQRVPEFTRTRIHCIAKEGRKLGTSLCQSFHHFLTLQRGQSESSILILVPDTWFGVSLQAWALVQPMMLFHRTASSSLWEYGSRCQGQVLTWGQVQDLLDIICFLYCHSHLLQSLFSSPAHKLEDLWELPGVNCLIQLTGLLSSHVLTSRWTVSTALQMLKKRSSNLRGKWEAACFVAQLPSQKKNNVHRKKPNTLLSLQTLTMG